MANMFNTPAPPPPPTPVAPPTMPDPMSPAALEAQRLAAAKGLRAGGRQSTILSTQASRAGGTIAGGYGGSKLGAG